MPDICGVARGKIMPAEKYCEDLGIHLPEQTILQTVTGDYPADQRAVRPNDGDMVLRADPDTIRLVPWAAEPTAQVIHDCYFPNGEPVDMTPRYVLRRVLGLYEARGWRPVVAPELEFYLVRPNPDSDYALEPPIGRSGRAESWATILLHRCPERVRPSHRRHLPVLRGAEHRARHAHPRGRDPVSSK